MGPLDKSICTNCNEVCEFIKQLDTEFKSKNAISLINVRYKKKETVIKQNSHSAHVIYLKSGLVKLFTERRNDKNIILRIATPGTYIGTTLLHTNTFDFSAVALRDCELCLIPKEVFMDFLFSNKEFSKFIYEANSLYTSFLINKISSLGTKQMHGRLADVILYLCRSEFLGYDIFDFITRRDIAEMSGMSSESAIRLLTEFKNDGLIKTNGKKIDINNLELLTRLSEIG
jgi:CRP/FNR family transcriptional regulator, polysaccharide utilization system transcription regulator